MSIPHFVAAGVAGDQVSRAVTGTDEVSDKRSAIATVAGGALGAAGTGAVSAAASAAGLTSAAAVVAAAPVAVPVIAASALVAFIFSRFD